MGYKSRIWLIILAIGLVVILYFMPDKAKVDKITEGPESPPADEHIAHAFSMEKAIESAKMQFRPAQLALVNELDAQLKRSAQPSAGLLDSLARAWDALKQPGIAAGYFEQKAGLDNTEKSYIDASYRYFDAYKASEDSVAQSGWVQKAIACYQKVLELNPANLDAKTDLGVCYAEGTNDPMKGIMLLRDVVKENPEHENAQLNLGFLSVKSGQYEKAMERFDKVLQVNPGRLDVYIFKGETALQMGNKQMAMEFFNTFMKESTDERMKKQVAAYISELKKQQ